jgi:hypothetical protein
MPRAISRFKELSPIRQAAITGVTEWNITLSVIAERDIRRRPAADIRGNKVLWRVVCLTNTVGPLSYVR